MSSSSNLGPGPVSMNPDLSSLPSLEPRRSNKNKHFLSESLSQSENQKQCQNRSHDEENHNNHVQNLQYEYLDHTADVQFHSWGKSLGESIGNSIICMFSYMTDLSKVIEMEPDDPQNFLLAEEEENPQEQIKGSSNKDERPQPLFSPRLVSATGHDAYSLLYNILDEFLFLFATEEFIVKRVTLNQIKRPTGSKGVIPKSANQSSSSNNNNNELDEGQDKDQAFLEDDEGEGDQENWSISFNAFGTRFDLSKHSQGTEIKAITYSAMQIIEPNHKSNSLNQHSNNLDQLTHVYVIVDI